MSNSTSSDNNNRSLITIIPTKKIGDITFALSLPPLNTILYYSATLLLLNLLNSCS